jgi:hypothetical protein
MNKMPTKADYVAAAKLLMTDGYVNYDNAKQCYGSVDKGKIKLTVEGALLRVHKVLLKKNNEDVLFIASHARHCDEDECDLASSFYDYGENQFFHFLSLSIASLWSGEDTAGFAMTAPKKDAIIALLYAATLVEESEKKES